MEKDLRRNTAQIAERWAETVLTGLGYDVRTNGHNDTADLIVNDSLRVEVKASFWVSHKTRKGRYQWNTRQSPDLFILFCMGTNGHAFVIPGTEIGDRTNIAVWSRDPERYAGQWAGHLDDWEHIERMLGRCQTSSDM